MKSFGENFDNDSNNGFLSEADDPFLICINRIFSYEFKWMILNVKLQNVLIKGKANPSSDSAYFTPGSSISHKS